MSDHSTRPGRALVCAPLPPEYDRESGSRRIYHFIDFLLESGWEVVFTCENAATGSRHLRHLRQRGVATYVGFDGAFYNMVEAGDHDLAIFAFWYIAHRYADVVRRLSPRTRVVVESIDLHWLREARRILAPQAGDRGILDSSFSEKLASELNTYAHADAVFTVSEKEADMINDIVGGTSLARSVPDFDETPLSKVPWQDRSGVLFVGNFRHAPNVDAVQYLCEEILPLLPSRLRYRHPLWIVGNGLDGGVAEMARGSRNVRLVGWVPEVEPYLHHARVSVVPLRYGAGTKRKLIQSLLAGTPSVTTPIGVEGMEVEDGKHLMVREDAGAIARAMEALLTDEALWSSLSGAGRRRMLRYHGRPAARKRFESALRQVLARPSGPGHPLSTSSLSRLDQRRMEIEALRRAVEEAVPSHTSALVVSKGDPDLLDLPVRRARHFPEAEAGGYAGYHPRDSRAAVHHLAESREDAEYLIFPASSGWWLDHYEGFAHHLASRHERVWSDDACVIFRLAPAEGAGLRSSVPPRRSNGSPIPRFSL